MFTFADDRGKVDAISASLNQQYVFYDYSEELYVINSQYAGYYNQALGAFLNAAANATFIAEE